MSNSDPLPKSDGIAAELDFAISNQESNAISGVHDGAVSEVESHISSKADAYAVPELSINTQSEKLEKVDIWLRFIEGNPIWLPTVKQELQTYQDEITRFDEDKRKDEHDKLWKVASTAMDKLNVISYSIMRLDPDSRCSTTSQALKEALLTLIYKIRPQSTEMKLDNALVRRKDTFLAHFYPGGHETSTSNRFFNTRTDVLLKMLFSCITSVSNELKAFLDKMNIWKSSEMDTVQASLLLLSIFIKHCAKITFVEGKDASPTYAGGLTKELGKQLTALSGALDELIQSALPGFEEDFRDREKRTMAESFNLLTIATFFSSITASTLAISVQQKSTLYDIVNLFWFASLVLSITSVMNSLLAFTWKQSIFRKRSLDEQIKLPPLIAAWSRDSPLYFMVAAALTYIIGLCLLAYATSQPKWSSAITTILTGLSIIGIVCATAWFIAEYYAHRMITKRFGASESQIHSPAVQSRVSDERYSSVFSIVFNELWLNICTELRRQGRRVGFGQLGSGGLIPGKIEKAPITQDAPGRKETGQSIPIQSATLRTETPMLEKLIKALSSVTPKVLESNDATMSYHESDGHSVRWISFSTDGELLGVCKRNTVYLYSVPEQKMLQKITSESGQFRGRLVWLPRSNFDVYLEKCFILLTTRGFQIWRENKYEDGRREFCRLRDINIHFDRSFVYGMFPDGGSFWVVTESRIKQFHVSRTGSHSAKNSAIRDDSKPEWESKILNEMPMTSTGSTPDSEAKLELRVHACCFLGGEKEKKSHFLISGEYFDRTDESEGKKNRYELIVYDFQDSKVESSIPLFRAACSLRLSDKDGSSDILVGYLNEPPQLWRYEGLSHGVMCLQPYQVYEHLSREKTSRIDRDAKNQGDVFFFGATNEFVGRWVDEGHELAPGVLVWEKTTAVFICEIPSRWIGKDMAERGIHKHTFEVNPSHTHASLMFATLGNGGGDLSLWTSLTRADDINIDTNEQVDNKENPEVPRAESPVRRRARLFRGRQSTV